MCHQLVGWLGGIGFVLSLIAYQLRCIRRILADLLEIIVSVQKICDALRPTASRRRSRKRRASRKTKR